MKQKLMLMVLALAMCSTVGFAQEREYKVEGDGYEWYEITKTVNGVKKKGAEDRNGNTIIPTEYDEVTYLYHIDNSIAIGFLAKKDKYYSWYNKSGKCIIPYSRGYKWVQKWDDDEFGTYYHFKKPGGGGLCDRNGKEVVFVKADGLDLITPFSETVNGKKVIYISFMIKKDGQKLWGIADANGNIVVAPKKEFPNVYDSNVTTTNNPLAGNRHETMAEAEGRPSNNSNSYANTNTQNNNPQGQNNTIVVEHHRDPIPMQQWQACFACGGMGTMGCDGCGGSGTRYYGDHLRICSRCNGRGLIPCNICYGNKGQYITVYQ